MAVPPSRPDPVSPAAVASASFTTSRKGFDTDEVRDFLRSVSAEMTRLRQQVSNLEREVDAARAQRSSEPTTIDEDTLTALLGEETARIVQTAREAAAQIKGRAEESAAKMLRDASEESARVRAALDVEVARRRADSTSDAEAEVEMARQQGREMVNEAREYREKVLADVARRRELARAQLEQMVHGRDRLLNAFERARLAAVDVMAELAPLGAEPDELVNLAPTTGPVPLVPRESLVERALQDDVSGAAERAPDAEVPTSEVPTSEVPLVESPDMYDVDDEPDADWVVDDAVEPDEASDGHEASGDEDTEVDDIDPIVDEPSEDDSAESGQDDSSTDDDPDPDPDGGRSLELVTDATDDAATTPESPEATPTADSSGDSDRGGELLRLPAPDDDVDEDDDAEDDRPSAPVVSLFAGEIDRPSRAAASAARESAVATLPESNGSTAEKPTVDDLFAKLRRASAAMVAKEAAEALAAAPEPGAGAVDVIEEPRSDVGDPVDGSIFAVRDEALVPLILSAARKLKRVLADEQNDVLDALRRTVSVDRVEKLLPGEAEQADRYLGAVSEDLRAAAIVGAGSLSTAADGDVQALVAAPDVLGPVGDAFAADVVRPLRERLDRAVMQVGEDSAELATLVRNVYREWKTQRIDEHVEDLVRLAHGRGAFAALSPGATVCWRVDPSGPACADAEDNALGGAVAVGDAFPTGHTHPPAHSGCRCLLETAPE